MLSRQAGRRLFATFPTMEEYILKSPRIVTPIYPTDAASIAALLNLHVSPPESPDEPPVEVLEAGTGHGSLTLSIARQLYAANVMPGATGAVLHTIETRESHTRAAERLLARFRRGIYS